MTGKRLEIGIKTKNLSQKFPALRLGSEPALAEERRDLHKRGKVVSILEAEGGASPDNGRKNPAAD